MFLFKWNPKLSIVYIATNNVYLSLFSNIYSKLCEIIGLAVWGVNLKHLFYNGKGWLLHTHVPLCVCVYVSIYIIQTLLVGTRGYMGVVCVYVCECYLNKKERKWIRVVSILIVKQISTKHFEKVNDLRIITIYYSASQGCSWRSPDGYKNGI